MEELERFREVPAHQWPFPEGYTYRLLKGVGSEIYGRDCLAEEWGRKFLKDHGAWGIMLFRQMVMSPCRTLDAMFITGRS